MALYEKATANRKAYTGQNDLNDLRDEDFVHIYFCIRRLVLVFTLVKDQFRVLTCV